MDFPVNMATFHDGQAPWQKSYPAGQAPWEKGAATPPTPKTGGVVGRNLDALSPAQQAGQKFAQDTQATANSVENKQITPTEGRLDVTAGLGTGLVSAVSGTITDAASKFAPNWLKQVGGAAAKATGSIASALGGVAGKAADMGALGPIASAVHPAMQKATELYNQLQKTSPRLAKDLMDVLEISSTALAAEQAPKMVADAAGMAVEAPGAIAGAVTKAKESGLAKSASSLEQTLETG